MTENKIIIDEWTITYNPKPIPDRRFDYDVVHKDYDEDNNLFFYAASIEEAKQGITARLLEDLNQ